MRGSFSYYMVSLLSYLLDGVPGLKEAKPFVVAASVPVVAIGLFALLMAVRRRMAKDKASGDRAS